MKVIVPIAGNGVSLKPLSQTTPKPLIEVAGKPILSYVIEEILTLNPTEIIFVIGYRRKQIKDYIKKFYPKLNCSFVIQKKRDGDGSAIRLALENCENEEELFIFFGADTLIDFNLKKSLAKLPKTCDSIIYGAVVENPSLYGILNTNQDDEIISVVEKPKTSESKIAIIGAYYFKSLLQVKKLLNEFYQNKETIMGEYKLVQVIDFYIRAKDLSSKICLVDRWFDCGNFEGLLDANRYFLKKSSKISSPILMQDSVIIPPAYISKSAKIKNSVIGPYVSVGDDVVVENSILRNSSVSSSSQITNLLLENSILGKDVILDGKFHKLNLGDKSQINFN